MVISRQGVRSSRTGPISSWDRKRMRKLDRAIARLDYRIWILSFWNTAECEKAKRERDVADSKRIWMRHWMKKVDN